MNQRARTGLLIAGALVVAVVLFVVLRPSDEDESAAPTTPTAPTVSVEVIRTHLVRIVYQGGRVVGGIRDVELELGDRLTLRVASSVADHVHVHGYDLMRDVVPGRPAVLTFRVTTPGRFEVELEERQVPIAELDVRP